VGWIPRELGWKGGNFEAVVNSIRSRYSADEDPGARRCLLLAIRWNDVGDAFV
jgi:hypothetical protein